MAILADTGVDWRHRNLIKKLYVDQDAFVRHCWKHVVSTGVVQGCSLSPLLFIIYHEAMVREVCHKCVIGTRPGKDYKQQWRQ